MSFLCEKMMIKKNFTNNIKVKHKLILVYIICVVIPIVAINCIFYQSTAENVREMHENYYQMSTERVASLIEKDLNFLISQSNKIYMDRQLYEMLDTIYETNLAYVEAYFNYFKTYLYLNGESYPQISKMMLYTENPTILNSGVVQRIDKRVKEEPWYQKVMNSPDRMHLVYDETEIRGDNSVVTPVSIILVLDQYQGIDRYSKILKTDLYNRNIIDILASENLRGHILLVSDNNELLFADMNIDEQYQLEEYLYYKKEQIIESRINRYF